MFAIEKCIVINSEKSVKNEFEERKFKFLVVDDSMINRKMLCKLLTSDGHTCVQASDGLDAVEKVKNNMSAQMTSRLSSDPSENDNININNNEIIHLDNINITNISMNDNENNDPSMDLHNLRNTDLMENNYYLDAILMDFMMPNMDGPTATTIIREMGFTGPIIGVTGGFIIL